MDAYDDEADTSGIFGGGGGAYYARGGDDPYIKLAAGTAARGDPDADSAASSDAGDWELRPDDLLLLAARNEDDVSHLEVWVFEEAAGAGDAPNVYVHHDVLLAAFPLALAWLDAAPGGASGNFCAVGSMEPGIELWNLDVADAVEPIAVLGPDAGAEAAAAGAAKASGEAPPARAKRSRRAAAAGGAHADAVLGLAWNGEYRNVLASASADRTVKVWDVAAGAAVATLTHHTGKVQAVAFNPAEPPILLSGGFDGRAVVADVRAPARAPAAWVLGADVEAAAWDPASPTCFCVSTDDGVVSRFDARAGAGSAPLWRLSAHDKPVTALSFCPAAPGLLATASTDKRVKLWDAAAPAPALVAASDLKVGAVFAAGFCAASPSLLAAGGAKGAVAVWDVASEAAVRARWGKALGGGGGGGGPAAAES